MYMTSVSEGNVGPLTDKVMEQPLARIALSCVGYK